MKRLLPFALFAASFAVSSAAFAHIDMTSPAPRNDLLKDGPCGGGSTDKRGKKITTLKPGSTITVTWKETVGHPGYYRISFDPNGQSFPDPKSFDDHSVTTNVLVDSIKDKSGEQTYSQEVTLPNVECTTCTLQLIQMMTDKPPYGDGNDLYYQCADIVLSNDAPDPNGEPPPAETPATPPASSKGEDSSCASSSSRSTPTLGALFAAGAIALVTRRRRSR